MNGERIAIISVLILAPAALAQFAVIDVGSIAQTVQNGMTLVKQAEQMKAEYDHLIYQAKSIPGTVRQWASVHGVMQLASSSDSTGLNGPFLAAENSGTGAARALNGLVGRVDFSLQNVPTEAQAQMRRMMATTERMDGNVAGSTSTLGYYTAASPDYQARLQRLSATATSDNPDDNTAAALQKQSVAAQLLAIEGNSRLTEINRDILQQQNEATLLQREQLRNQLASDIAFYQTAPQVGRSFTSQVTDDLRNMRLPD